MEIQVIDLAPAAPTAGACGIEAGNETTQEEEAPPPPPLERQESVLAPVPEEEAPKPKRRGRPPGAKNKPKPKQPPPVEEEEEDEPRPPQRRVQMQTPYQQDHNLEMAQTLLNLMHAQAGAKAHQRRQLYQSWF